MFCVTSGAFALREVDGRAIVDMGWGDNMCALTFDDGPGPHTQQLLDLLDERGIKATFFVVGKQVSLRPQTMRRMQAEGHEIGNHTWSHVTLRHMPPEKQREEIRQVQDALAALGIRAHFLRPPYGRYDKQTLQVLEEAGMDIMLWSIDSMDWMHRASIDHMQTLVPGQRLRGIFLFHDTHSRTIEAMPEILDRLTGDGCRFVTVSQYLDAADQEAARKRGLPAVNPVPSASPAQPAQPAQPVSPEPSGSVASPEASGSESPALSGTVSGKAPEKDPGRTPEVGTVPNSEENAPESEDNGSVYEF